MLKPQQNALRLLVSLDGFWSFRRDPKGVGEAEGWANGLAGEYELAVPGSWNEQATELEQFFGRGWYQRSFFVPAGWAEAGVVLHVGSAQNHARVWVNGRLAGGHRGGCLPFCCALDDLLIPGGRNLLVIEVDGSMNPWDLPAARIAANAPREGFHNSNPAITYDFFPYCGIARPVSLQVTPTRARLTTVTVDSAVDLAAGMADVTVIVDHKQAGAAEVVVEIEGQSVVAVASGSDRAAARFKLAGIRLWEVGAPQLYTAGISLRAGRETVDYYEQTFGLRRVEVTGEQLLLNGRPVFLKGFGKHEDFPVVGRGLSLPVVVKDYDLMRWIGANSFRTSHYPYAEEWYEFADRHGILVIGETPLVGLCQRLFESADVLERARGVIGEMIARDRHHPSVIMWCVANEPWIESTDGEVFIAKLLAHARQIDGSRLVTYAAHMEPAHNAPCADCDIVCVNKYYGWYELPGDIAAGTARLGEMLDEFRAAFGKPVLFSEFGADAVPGLHALPTVMFSEEFQAEIIVAQIREARRRPWVVGTHVWAFSDFKTPQSITRVARNHKGVFTRERAPKMAAHAIHKLWAGGETMPPEPGKKTIALPLLPLQ